VKIIGPQQAAPQNRSVARPLPVVKAAIEKQRSIYILLVCGHFTTVEADLVYSFARPSKDKHWCEICNKWLKRVLKITHKIYPETPLF
jgi:hypothetical protein